MNRTHFVSSTCSGLAAVGLASAGVVSGAPLPPSIAGITLPTTVACRALTALARAAYPAPLFNHALRSFVLGKALAGAGEVLDDELFYVAALAHDLGLTDAYRSPNRRFEIDGADIARRLLLDHGVEANAARIAWDAVALHATGSIARWKEPEVRALARGVGADFFPLPDAASRRIAGAVFRALPRINFRETFLASTAEVARRKPDAAAGFVADVGLRLVKGFPKPSNFVDDLKERGLPD